MNQHVKQLAEEMRKLHPDQRADLIDELLAGLHEDAGSWDAAWAAEAARRWDLIERGQAKLHDADDVLRDIGERLRRGRKA